MTTQYQCPACGKGFSKTPNVCECGMGFFMHQDLVYFRERLDPSEYLITKTRPSLVDPKRRVSAIVGLACPRCNRHLEVSDQDQFFFGKCKGCSLLIETCGGKLVCSMPLDVPRSKPITGYPGPMGAMVDMGRFQIMNVQSRDNRNSGNMDFSFMCINDQNERVWFKTSEESTLGKDWVKTIGRRLDWSIPLDTKGFAADLRGKIMSIEETVTIVSNAKLKNIASIY